MAAFSTADEIRHVSIPGSVEISDEQLTLLATDGMLVKRPLVVGDGFVLTGFKEEEWTAKLK